MKNFSDAAGLFEYVHGREETREIVGMMKESDDPDEFLFSPSTCDDWIPIPRDRVVEITLLGERLCVQKGEDPHKHPFVRLVIRIGGSIGRYLELIATLASQRSSRANSNARTPFNDGGCEFGYGPCGGYNPDRGYYCDSGSRPCYEDGYTWCKPFPECGSGVARRSPAAPGAPFLPSDDISVGGEAGSCVDAWWDGQCYHAKNRCGRKVIMHFGNWSRLINPGGEWVLHVNGRCIGSYFGETWAEYER